MSSRILLPLALSLALGASGCVQITDQTSEQLELIGDVVVHTSLCAEGVNGDVRRRGAVEPTGECGVNDLGRAQLLLAYRVPDGAEPVEVASDQGLTPSESYAAQLEARHPSGDGRRWVAYAGEARAFGITRAAGAVDARFTLPGGQPFRGPFPSRTVVGYRRLPGAADAAAPIDCAAPTTACDTAARDVEQPTRDLAILSGGEITVMAGERGEVPFRAVFAGADDPGLDFVLAAAPAEGGARRDGGESSFEAEPRMATFHPAPDSETTVAVVVDVPAGASPGRRRVRLTARLANGQQRSGEATFTVVAPAKEAEVAAAPAKKAEVAASETRAAEAAAPRLAVEVSSRRCLSRRTVRIRLRRRGAKDTARVTAVRVNGRRAPFRTQGRTRLLVDLRGLPKQRYAYRIAARLSDGTVLVDPRRYRTCTPKRAQRLGPLKG